MNPEMSIANLPDDTKPRCYYCGREFASKQSLVSHLQNCEKRIRVKHVRMVYEGAVWVFRVTGNMSKRTMRGIYACEEKGDPQVLVSALFFAKASGYIHDWDVERKCIVEGGLPSLKTAPVFDDEAPAAVPP